LALEDRLGLGSSDLVTRNEVREDLREKYERNKREADTDRREIFDIKGERRCVREEEDER